jgi:uncharacterized protein YbjT (DUF2867 family)
MKVLVTGATGYIGGRLVPRLLEQGHDVRVMVRDPARVAGRPWASSVEVARGDVEDPESLGDALHGAEAAYYLIHLMGAGGDFAERDRRAAENFVAAGRHLRHVIYLGGLLPDAKRVSKHLRSRAEVGEILRAGLPTTEFRAGPVVGSGSASFEMVRYLTERLPAMIAPRWILNEVQPIAVRDILGYLSLALEREPAGIYNVGASPLTFKGMMQEFARVRGLRRLIVPVPVLAPRLAALWVGLVTPIPNRLAVPLVEGVDFWRVERVEPPSLLRLRAEMKVPGRAWLQWEAVPEDGGTQLVQTAIFEPVGLAGHLYWNLLYPIHKIIFSGLMRAIASRAEGRPSR